MQHSLATCVLSAGALALSAHSQTLVRAVNGPAANAQYGKACIEIPDQNGDGFKDLLVGAPGFNSLRGAIYCLSGAFLANGTGSQTLWSLAPTANQGDLFGFALADLGDVTGDNVHDFLVGMPGYDISGTNDIGAVRVVNGATHGAVSLVYGVEVGAAFGSALATCGDSTGNGAVEVVIGAPGPNSSLSKVWRIDSALLASASTSIQALPSWSAYQITGSEQLGAAIVSGFDLDGDAFQEVVVGRPGAGGPSAPNAGGLILFSNLPSGFFHIQTYTSSNAGERFGAALDIGGYYDSDAVPDLVVGAPNALDGLGGQAGRVALISGFKLYNDQQPIEIRSLSFSLANGFDHHFGAAVSATDDLNGDGVGDILAGAPDYFTFSGGLVPRGNLSIFSGATGTRWAGINGNAQDHFGDAIGGSIRDLDGDGFKEFVVSGALSDAGGADSGVVKCYRLFPLAPVIYCVGKLNSLGCTPSIASSGTPSANSGAPFTISASNFINQKNGLLFYAHQPTAVAFQGGTKCVHNPTVRTLPANSGGSMSGSDCTGAYAFDFNAWMVNGWDASLAAGSEVFAQYWSRDPASASHTGLSNAIRFVINP